MSDKFELHPDLQRKIFVANLDLSTLLLDPINEFDWLILVPRVPNIKNILDLPSESKSKLWLEVEKISEIVSKMSNPDQINIAMFGNVTPQLHCHVIARFKNDISWPASAFDKSIIKTPLDQGSIMQKIERIIALI